MRANLAWRQLSCEPLRMLVAVAGVAFAVILVFMQLGFRSAMLSSAVRYQERLCYDLVLVSPRTVFIGLTYPFPRRRLYQALALDSVQSVSPVYLQQQHWRNPWQHNTRNLLVMGIEPGQDLFDTPGVAENADRLRLEDVVLFDAASRPEFGPVAQHLAAGEEVVAEVANHRVTVAGIYRLGSSFGIDGNLLTSEQTFLRIFRDRNAGAIDLGLIDLALGRDPEVERARLDAMLPDDVQVLTRKGLVAREAAYWTGTTPIGYVFGFGLVMGLVVGAIIVYQILFAGVIDSLGEYATLKAMGYTNAAVSSLVLHQALILALLGFVPGLAATLALYGMASAAIRMPLEMTGERALTVLVLTFLMCGAAGLLALRRVRSADPAEVF